MNETLVLTIVGTDRPGIVSVISKIVSEHGGNWHESRMAHLAGQFAGLMRGQVPGSRYDELRRALEALSSEGLHVTVVKDNVPEAVADSEIQRLALEVTGSDHPGIVRDIFAVMAKYGVNVEELETEVSPAPMSSHSLFKASAVLNAPGGLDLDTLQDVLESLSHDLIIELAVRDADSGT